MKKVSLAFLTFLFISSLFAESGYRLWLRYNLLSEKRLINEYKQQIAGVQLNGNSPTITIAKDELTMGLSGLLGASIPFNNEIKNNYVVAGTPAASFIIRGLNLKE